MSEIGTPPLSRTHPDAPYPTPPPPLPAGPTPEVQVSYAEPTPRPAPEVTNNGFLGVSPHRGDVKLPGYPMDDTLLSPEPPAPESALKEGGSPALAGDTSANDREARIAAAKADARQAAARFATGQTVGEGTPQQPGEPLADTKTTNLDGAALSQPQEGSEGSPVAVNQPGSNPESLLDAVEQLDPRQALTNDELDELAIKAYVKTHYPADMHESMQAEMQGLSGGFVKNWVLNRGYEALEKQLGGKLTEEQLSNGLGSKIASVLPEGFVAWLKYARENPGQVTGAVGALGLQAAGGVVKLLSGNVVKTPKGWVVRINGTNVLVKKAIDPVVTARLAARALLAYYKLKPWGGGFFPEGGPPHPDLPKRYQWGKPTILQRTSAAVGSVASWLNPSPEK